MDAGLEEPAPLPRAFGSRGDNKLPGRQVVHDFLSRVLRLAHIRANDLCERLDFLPLDRSTVIAEVYTMLHYCCFEVTSLLYGRHIDQLLLCAIYGVCKVHQLKQVTFKDIIGQYKRQAQCKTDTFRSVAIKFDSDLQVRNIPEPLRRFSMHSLLSELCSLPSVGFLTHCQRNENRQD